MSRDSFLTERQIEMLRLRRQGLSQSEIARRIGTTRANVSATLKTAEENMRKAENTLRLWNMLNAHIWLVVERDTDLNDLPRMIYQRASEEDVWVNLDTPSLIGEIQRSCRNKIRGRRVVREIEIVITEEGDVIAR
ncbi:MAG: Tfx family DNA-binding protein [Methanobacteriota archaeon]|nr:MAG: Tfx family DNA-binding protein [Euryarchaeota archaeon]